MAIIPLTRPTMLLQWRNVVLENLRRDNLISLTQVHGAGPLEVDVDVRGIVRSMGPGLLDAVAGLIPFDHVFLRQTQYEDVLGTTLSIGDVPEPPRIERWATPSAAAPEFFVPSEGLRCLDRYVRETYAAFGAIASAAASEKQVLLERARSNAEPAYQCARHDSDARPLADAIHAWIDSVIARQSSRPWTTYPPLTLVSPSPVPDTR